MAHKTKRDPNRYATGAELDALCARLPDEEAELDVLTRKHERAQTALRVAKSRFQDIEAQYLMLKDVLSDAELYAKDTTLRRDAQAKIVRTQRGLLHPLRKIPPEILSEIFEGCLTHPMLDADLFDFELMRQRQLQPLRIAAVCKRWRVVATTASPRLWQYVDVDLSKNARNRPRVPFLHVSRVLARSGATSLSIRLSRPFPDNEEEDASVLKELAGAMGRCRVFSLIGPLYDAAHRLLALLQTSTPRLEELTISHLNVWQGVPNAYAHSVRVFPNAPLLRTMVSAFSSALNVEFPSLKWVLLTDAVSSTERDHIVHLLISSPALRHLKLVRLILAPSTRSLCVAPGLETLEVTTDSDEPIAVLSQRYSFPNLKSLMLYGSYPGSSRRAQYLALMASKSHLVELTLSEHLATDLIVVFRALKSMYQLALFTLLRSYFTREALDCLCSALSVPSCGDATASETPEAPSQYPCSALRWLELGQCEFNHDCNPRVLLDAFSTLR